MMHNNSSRAGVDTSLVMKFISTSFIYLLAGLVMLEADFLKVLSVQRDSLFILWLFGFVVMIIFGLSYMFASGLTRNSAFMNRTESAEYILLNTGIILFFAGFSGLFPVYIAGPAAILGLIILSVSVLIHLINIITATANRRTSTMGRKSFGDDY